MGLYDGQLGSRQHAARDITQTIFLILRFRLDKGTNRLLNQANEPDHDQRVTDVKRGMESGQLERNGNRRIRDMHNVRHEPRDCPRKRIENQQDPKHPEQVKHQMGQGGTARLRISRQRGEIGRDRRTDIFPQHEGDSQMVVDPTIRAHDECYRHRGGRGLDDHGQYGANKQEKNDREETHVRVILDEGQHFGIGLQIRSIGFQPLKPHKQERETEYKLADRLAGALSGEE